MGPTKKGIIFSSNQYGRVGLSHEIADFQTTYMDVPWQKDTNTVNRTRDYD